MAAKWLMWTYNWVPILILLLGAFFDNIYSMIGAGSKLAIWGTFFALSVASEEDMFKWKNAAQARAAIEELIGEKVEGEPLTEKDEEIEMNSLDLSKTDNEEQEFLDRFTSGPSSNDISSPSFAETSEKEYDDLNDMDGNEGFAL